jgi:hypothetical protein
MRDSAQIQAEDSKRETLFGISSGTPGGFHARVNAKQPGWKIIWINHDLSRFFSPPLRVVAQRAFS